MTPINDLENEIRSSYRLIQDFRERQRYSTTKAERDKFKQQIDDQWIIIQGLVNEYVVLTTNLSYSIPGDVIEIIARFLTPSEKSSISSVDSRRTSGIRVEEEIDEQGRVRKRTVTQWWKSLPAAAQVALIVGILGFIGTISAPVIKETVDAFLETTPGPTLVTIASTQTNTVISTPSPTSTFTPHPTITPTITYTPSPTIPPSPTPFFEDNFDDEATYRNLWLRDLDNFYVSEGLLYHDRTPNETDEWIARYISPRIGREFSIIEFRASVIDAGIGCNLGLNTSCDKDNPSEHTLILEINSIGEILGKYGDENDLTTLEWDQPMIFGEVYTITLVQDGPDVRTYINGIEMPEPYPCDHLGDWLNLGAGLEKNGGYVDAYLDYVRLWDISPTQ